MIRTLIIIGTVISFIECGSQKPNHINLQADCLADRSNKGYLDKERGKVQIIAGIYIITNEEENQRYEPCNFPEAYKIEGIAVIYSGTKKEIFPYERRIATPFVLSYIQKE